MTLVYVALGGTLGALPRYGISVCSARAVGALYRAGPGQGYGTGGGAGE